MTKIDQIAQAFAQGVKFAENLKMAMDAAKGKDDEAGHWVTVGEGEEARPVFIKGAKKKADKTESKKATNQKAETAQRTERKTSDILAEYAQARKKLMADIDKAFEQKDISSQQEWDLISRMQKADRHKLNGGLSELRSVRDDLSQLTNERSKLSPLEKRVKDVANAINNISVPARSSLAFLDDAREGMGEYVQNYFADTRRAMKKAQTAASEGKISADKQQKLMDTLKNSNCLSKLSHEVRRFRNHDTDSLEGINRAMDACNKFIRGIEDNIK